MRTALISILIALTFGFAGRVPDKNFDDEGNTYRAIKNRAFRVGEKATYLVHYGIIDAGFATLEIKKTDMKMNGRELLHLVGTGRSQGMVDFFFHVEDRYESYVDRDGLFPWLFIRNINEGGYKCQQTYKFFQNKHKVETQKGKTHDVPSAVQDMLSAAFYARTLDIGSFRKDQVINVPSFVDDATYNLKIRYKGVEVIDTKSGKYRCAKFNPVVQTGRLFKREDDMDVWITDDENKIPVLCRASILVGSIKVELVDYEGLANPVAHLGK